MPPSRPYASPERPSPGAPQLPSSEHALRQARVVELFAGVGGFHLGLTESGWSIVWANQWEPSTKRVQHAFSVYQTRLPGPWLNDLSNTDIAAVPADCVPEHELLAGGFPCQDYSVAKPLPQATGIRGKKGILWWQIYRILHAQLPPMVLLENVDRLLNSPAAHRGRDFAIILTCLNALGYSVEWRVVNAADYGFPQRRRRVFIYGQRSPAFDKGTAWHRLFRDGVFASTLPVEDHLQSKAKDEPFRSQPTVRFPPFGSQSSSTPH